MISKGLKIKAVEIINFFCNINRFVSSDTIEFSPALKLEAIAFYTLYTRNVYT